MNFRARKIWFSGTQKSVLLKASSEESCAPHDFVLLAKLGSMCLPHRVPLPATNESDYGKINVETNSRTVVSTRTTSLTWRH